MTTRSFELIDLENTDPPFLQTENLPTETTPSTKLERRRRIEDLFEEKRLREELREFG